MKEKIIFLSVFIFIIHSGINAKESNSDLPSDVMETPYEACKGTMIVSKEQYQKNSKKWKDFEASCGPQIQLAEEAGITKLNSLNEGVQYLNVATKVAEKIVNNLEKNQKYAECARACFSGATTCSAQDSDTGKIINCNTRKEEIVKNLKLQAAKIRTELALARDDSDLVQVNVHNVLNLDNDKRFNNQLQDFEIGPNPVGNNSLSANEKERANKIIQTERDQIEIDYQKMIAEKNIPNTPELAHNWKSKVLMDRIDKRKEEHQLKYRQLIYEESPLFAVIDKPAQFQNGETPIWTDQQIAEAFTQLSKNAKKTEDVIKTSLSKGKLEFSRIKGEALGEWFKSLVPGTQDSNDLLYYMGMKNQVEEVLREDKSLCAAATTMNNRLNSKEMQNMGVVFVGSFVGGAITKEISKTATGLFRIGRALSGAEAANLTGLAIGASYLGDSFHQYNKSVSETVAGLRDASSIEDAKKNVALNLIFAPPLGPIGWSLGKTLYSALATKMGKDLPELTQLIKQAGTSQAARDQIVDKWMMAKVKAAIKGKILDNEDEALLKSKDGGKILDLLASDIQKNNPTFFKNPNNFDFFLKTAATSLKKRPGDPIDLGEKSRDFFLHFNSQAFQTWDPKARLGLMKVFDEGVESLRKAYAKDPATYAKFSSDPASQEKIMEDALRNSGVVDDAKIAAMKTCALKKK